MSHTADMRLTRVLVIGAVGISLLATNASAATNGGSRGTDPYLTTGATGYDVLHYDLTLNYAPSTHGIAASRVEISAAATTDLKAFTLDMSQRLGVIDVLVNDRPARFSHLHDKLGVSPAAVLPARKQFRVAIRYRGNPGSHPDTSGRGPVGWQHTTGGSVAYTEPDGTYEYMPSKDVLYDKATWLVHLNAPAPVTGVSTGQLVSRTTAHGVNRTVFRQDASITNYQQMIAFDAFLLSTQTINGIRSLVAVTNRETHPGSGNSSLGDMTARTKRSLTWLTDRLGPFPYQDTGAIVTSGGDSAMETAGRPTYSNDSSYDYSEAVVLHELAHQWFGGRLTATNTSDVWLHEAFATWLERHWQATHTFGSVPRDWLLRRNYLRDGFVPDKAGQFGTVSVEDPTNAYRLESTVYYRGAMAVEALHSLMSLTAFDKLLRGLAQQPAGHTFTTSQFVKLAEQLSGKDLTEWRATWLSSKDPQTPPAAPTYVQITDELATDIGQSVYNYDTTDLTPSMLTQAAQNAVVQDPTWLPMRLLTIGTASSGTSGDVDVTRLEVSVPAGGIYPVASKVCLTFPKNLRDDGDYARWYYFPHAPYSTDYAPNTATQKPCPA
jgi:aminopeptidase N